MQTIDVRTISPHERHPTIFKLFDSLAEGDAFIIVNDHDPKPLSVQLNMIHFGKGDWEYLESGPLLWRVKIGRKK